MLVNDKAKFTTLLEGITFAVFLMVQMDAMFAGSMKRASATVINLGASMWIMDPAVRVMYADDRERENLVPRMLHNPAQT